jgi:phosphate transport system substrate-binding protein
VSAGVLATSAALLAASMPAGAAGFKVDAIMKNDLKIHTAPSSPLVLGGSSFDYPLVLAAESQWNSDTHKSNVLAPDLSNKSGLGRSNMLSGAYAIGFSDFPLNQVPGSPDIGPGTSYPSLTSANFAQVPIALGGEAITYHFGTGVSGTAAALIKKYGVTLKGSTLGRIFAGKVTNWHAKEIANENPHLVVKGKDLLPNLAIQVMSRTAGSGTTFIFRGYLSLVDHTDFPKVDATNFTAAGSNQFANSGLLQSAVQSTNGAIGYVEFGYAIANNSPTLQLVNKSGKSVALSEAGIVQAATVGLKAITANRGCKGFKTTVLACYEINNELGLTVYPIAGFSYGMIYKTQTNKTNAVAEVKFLDFLSHQGGGKSQATTFGQDLADANGYAPMPVSIQAVARAVLLGVKVGGKVFLNTTN